MKKTIIIIIAVFLLQPATQAQKIKKLKNKEKKGLINNAKNLKTNPTPLNNTIMYQNIFKQADWIRNADVYEVNLRQYTEEGTFNAFVKELPRLKKMGVSTLWFMPITPIAERKKKGSLGSPYACSDYTAINPEFGTLQDFKDLVNEAHKQGFKVIIDWVANHTGWDHVWTKTNPEYYEIDPSTKDFKIASGMDDIIELDFKKPELRKAMIDAMKYWVEECDIDGYRCDLAFWVELDFWLEARAELQKTKVLFWLAECDAIDNAEYFKAFDACYSWTWMHKTKEFYEKGFPVDELRELLVRYNDAGGGKAMQLWFTTNHDENSWNGTEYEKYGDAAYPLAVFSFTWNGIPLIYSGQEMPNEKRLDFFEKDAIKWSGNYKMESFYKTLLNLRKTNKALLAGDTDVRTYWLNTTADKNLIAYVRKNEDKEVITILNMSNHNVSFNILNADVVGAYKNVFTNKIIKLPVQNNIELDRWGYLVLEK